jgi:hypothetical protein
MSKNLHSRLVFEKHLLIIAFVFTKCPLWITWTTTGIVINVLVLNALMLSLFLVSMSFNQSFQNLFLKGGLDFDFKNSSYLVLAQRITDPVFTVSFTKTLI